MRTLSGLKLNELENIMQEMNATKFRAKQIHNWIYLKSVKEIDKRIEEENRQLSIAKYQLQQDYNKQKKENDKVSQFLGVNQYGETINLEDYIEKNEG